MLPLGTSIVIDRFSLGTENQFPKVRSTAVESYGDFGPCVVRLRGNGSGEIINLPSSRASNIAVLLSNIRSDWLQYL